jgi:hypothetical protein
VRHGTYAVGVPASGAPCTAYRVEHHDRFQHDGKEVLCGQGEGLLHAGGLTHCGVPVTKGTRYLLVLFLLATTQVSELSYSLTYSLTHELIC